MSDLNAHLSNRRSKHYLSNWISSLIKLLEIPIMLIYRVNNSIYIITQIVNNATIAIYPLSFLEWSVTLC